VHAADFSKDETQQLLLKNSHEHERTHIYLKFCRVPVGIYKFFMCIFRAFFFSFCEQSCCLFRLVGGDRMMMVMVEELISKCWQSMGTKDRQIS